MLQRRTDLAAEAVELQEGTPCCGIVQRERLREGYPVTEIEVCSAQAAQALGKPRGRYATLDLSALPRREADAFGRAVRAVREELRQIMPLHPEQAVLVVGLGNRAITPDAIGPLCVEHTLVTRHLVEQLPEQFGTFRPVTALAAGVLGNTGVESGEIVRALCDKLHPDAVIAVDALASRSLNRVCSTVQISSTGIIPGSGVGNARTALNRETLGVPVYAVGVPTVVDGATLAADLLAEAGREALEPEALRAGAGEVFVTPRDIDARVADLSRVLGYGITLALQEELRLEDAELLLN